jgi:hypothetical protein
MSEATLITASAPAILRFNNVMSKLQLLPYASKAFGSESRNTARQQML